MNKAELLKEELKKIGIFSDADLKTAIKKISIDISLMAGEKKDAV